MTTVVRIWHSGIQVKGVLEAYTRLVAIWLYYLVHRKSDHYLNQNPACYDFGQGHITGTQCQ
jgi:hypothetical protein